MAVEVQTIVLSQAIENVTGGIADLKRASIYQVFPTGGEWPLDARTGFYVLLRKDVKGLAVPFELKIRMMDEDGQTTPKPGIVTVSGTFPAGHRFWGVTGTIQLSMMKKGNYCLLFETHSQGTTSQFRYDLEAIDRPPGQG